MSPSRGEKIGASVSEPHEAVRLPGSEGQREIVWRFFESGSASLLTFKLESTPSTGGLESMLFFIGNRNRSALL